MSDKPGLRLYHVKRTTEITETILVKAKEGLSGEEIRQAAEAHGDVLHTARVADVQIIHSMPVDGHMDVRVKDTNEPEPAMPDERPYRASKKNL